MPFNTSHRPGYADIRIAGVQLSVGNNHRALLAPHWLTGIYADSWRTTEGKLTWWVDIFVLGFSVGVCR